MRAPLSTLRIQRLTPALGAGIEGVDLGAPLADGDVAAIEEALSQYLVLFFVDQSLSPVQQRDFAARFGKLYTHPFYPGEPDAPEIMILAHDAAHRASSDRWHNDVTYLEAPPKAAVLYTEEIPEVGGDTLWANMYLAYETLAEPVKALVSGLRAVHSFAKNFTAGTVPRSWNREPARASLCRASSGLASRCSNQSEDGPQGALREPRLHDAHRSSLLKRKRCVAALSLRAYGTTGISGSLAMAAADRRVLG